MSTLTHLSTYLPTTRFTLEELSEQGIIPHNDLSELLKRGFCKVPLAINQTSLDILFSTLDQLFKSDIDKERITRIIMPYSHYSFPHVYDLFGMIKERYNLPNAEGFSLKDLYCSTFLLGIKMMDLFIKQNNNKELGLIVSIEKAVHSQLIYWEGYPFVTGDAGVAAIMSGNSVGTDVLAVEVDIVSSENKLMDFSIMINIYKLIGRTLEKAGLTLSDVKLIIPNNTNSNTWIQFSKLLKVSENIFYQKGLKEFGHINNCDLLLNMNLAEKSEVIKKGDIFILLSTAVGGGMGCAVCRKG